MSALSHDYRHDADADYDYDLDEFNDRARVKFNRERNLPDDYDEGASAGDDYDPDDYDPDAPRCGGSGVIVVLDEVRVGGWRYVRPDALTRERDCPGCGDCRAAEESEEGKKSDKFTMEGYEDESYD